MDEDEWTERARELHAKMRKDAQSRRVTTRWHNIEGKIDLALSRVKDEAKTKALERGLFTSTHEGLGVIVEELAELVEAVRINDDEAVIREAVQVSASGLPSVPV